jgi:hypothetical protein
MPYTIPKTEQTGLDMKVVAQQTLFGEQSAFVKLLVTAPKCGLDKQQI